MKKYILNFCLLSITATNVFAANPAETLPQKTYKVSVNTYNLVSSYYGTGNMPDKNQVIARYGFSGALDIRDDLNAIIKAEGLDANTPLETMPSLAAERHIILECGGHQLDCHKEESLLKAGMIGKIQLWASSPGFKATCAGAVAGIIVYYLIKSYNKNIERRKDRISPKWAFGAATAVGLGSFAYLNSTKKSVS